MAITKYPVVSSAIKLVQRGTITLVATEASKTVTITAVNMNKSFMNFSWNIDDNTSNSNVYVPKGEITNTTTLTFSTNASFPVNTGKTLTINWEVIEYI